VVAGQSLRDSYKAAYSTSRMSDGALHVEASRLMAHPKVTLRVQRLQQQMDRAITATALSDRDRVLQKLRDLLDTDVTADHRTQLGAARLLGQSVGLFKDVQQVQEEPKMTAAEIREEIQRRLAAFADNAVH